MMVRDSPIGGERRDQAVDMRRTIVVLLALAGISSAPLAKLPPRGSVGLYADGARAYGAYCMVYPADMIGAVEMWVWCLPGENGLEGAEFAVSYPSNTVLDRITYSGALSHVDGDPLSGLSILFAACQWDWCWVAHQTLYVNSLQGTSLEIVPHPVPGVFRFFNCAEGNPAEPCLKGAVLYLNAPGQCLPPETAIGAGGVTWGAVKSLYGD
jgi:hypothetical protein